MDIFLFWVSSVLSFLLLLFASEYLFPKAISYDSHDLIQACLVHGALLRRVLVLRICELGSNEYRRHSGSVGHGDDIYTSICNVAVAF